MATTPDTSPAPVETMSLFTKWIGLDKHPAELKAINAVGATILNSPIAKSGIVGEVVQGVEAVVDATGATAAATAAAPSTFGGVALAAILPFIVNIINALVPNFIGQIDKVLTDTAVHFGIDPKAFEAFANTELEKLGFSAPKV